MSLQIGPALRSGADNLFSRTGAILLAAYIAVTAALLPLSNTMLARLYEDAGLTAATDAIPLVLDVPLAVAAGGYLVGALAGAYLSIVAMRTFVAGTGAAFPDGALSRNVPLAMANAVAGGIVYSLLIFLGSVALVVPGIIAYVAFLFMLPYVAVEDRNFVDALRSSYRLSKGNWLSLFVLVLIVVSVAGFLGGVGGLFSALLLPPAAGQLALVVVTSPLSLLSLAVVAAAFDQLREAADSDDRSGSTSAAETPSTPV
ncbi:hypothetical protein NDI56_15305 [Haloarcula sp. S1CR25-12]|uniref:DUF7847 domain-containing protein n=1 Tax=Haloarcula saliterrae TaxID=2950534 RepID=A0ABU2FEU1_9EURY|nr:hypothetical protein [Haloarcula sp. S1CR25-12]MDS0260774.1 hypothetical protein [Haloarcula sp. S1CR25-12]